MGGAIGAPLRFALTMFINRELSQPSFPAATLAINASGSFVLALVFWASAARLGPDARLLIGTGLLGAFTTYSTFSVETVQLVERSRPLLAAGYVSATVGLCLGAAYLGMQLAKSAG
ncbi:MAG TPA: fluoride efflux transporter CrcB [Thermomicrobiales bacterium]|nr:fluoride efflux transporter CrcB [Thermomicrobiales bacterium]